MDPRTENSLSDAASTTSSPWSVIPDAADRRSSPPRRSSPLDDKGLAARVTGWVQVDGHIEYKITTGTGTDSPMPTSSLRHA